MSPFLTLFLLALALFALFWGVGRLAQAYLYNEPADRLPLRSLAAALLVAGFVTMWVAIDRRSPGKYDTFFEFAPYDTRTFDEFEAVRWQADPAAVVKGKVEFRKGEKGEPVEKTAKFKRAPGGKTAGFVEEGTGKAFQLSGTGSDGISVMTAALVVKDEAGNPVRYKAELTAKDRRGNPVRYTPEMKADELSAAPTYANDRRFVEENGSRYVKADQLGVVYVPSTGVVAASLALNLLLFVVWFAALWPVMRFGWGHALGLAVVAGLVTMLIVMPLLFRPNRAPKAPANPPAEKAESVSAAWGGRA